MALVRVGDEPLIYGAQEHAPGTELELPDELAAKLLKSGQVGDDEPAGDPGDLSTLKLPALRALATEREIDLGDAKKKGDIIALIEAAEPAGDEN